MKALLLFSGLLTVAISAQAAADPSDLIRQGDVYDDKYQPDKALEYYLPAEKQNPKDTDLLVKIARQYVYRMDDLGSKSAKLESGQTALNYAKRAVEIAPNKGDPHLSVAIVLGKMSPLLGNKEKLEASKRIKASAEKAAKLNPGNDYAWHLLGRWHQAIAGMSGFTRGLAQMIYGSMPGASNEESVKYFEKAIQLNPNRLVHYIELGRTYAQMGREEEARAMLKKGLAMPNKAQDDAETKRRGREALEELD